MQKFLKNHVFSLIAWVLILIISIVALPNIKTHAIKEKTWFFRNFIGFDIDYFHCCFA